MAEYSLSSDEPSPEIPEAFFLCSLCMMLSLRRRMASRFLRGEKEMQRWIIGNQMLPCLSVSM
jgi:hypothetical protein